jgi:hypothetical protein
MKLLKYTKNYSKNSYLWEQIFGPSEVYGANRNKMALLLFKAQILKNIKRIDTIKLENNLYFTNGFITQLISSYRHR